MAFQTVQKEEAAPAKETAFQEYPAQHKDTFLPADSSLGAGEQTVEIPAELPSIEGTTEGRQRLGTVSINAVGNDIKQRFKEMHGQTIEGEITGEDLLKQDVQQLPCLLGTILQKVGCACLAGGSDTGKSSFLRDLAIHCATGCTHFLGFELRTEHKSVIYVSTEDDKGATSFLLRKQALGHEPSHLDGLRFIFETIGLLGRLDASLTRKSADLVIIDCFADAFGGDLKDSQQIRTYLNEYQRLAEKHQCLFLFLHHTSKRTENLEPSKNNLLSGQGFEAKMRLVMELRLDLMSPGFRHLCIVKGNYLPAAEKRESFVLQFNEQSFTFSNTGERTPFELLVKQADDGGKARYEQAKELKEKGYKYEDIAPAIGYKDKSSVSKLFDRAKKSGWDS